MFIMIMLFYSITKMRKFGETEYVDNVISKPLNYTSLKDKWFPGGVNILKFDEKHSSLFTLQSHYVTETCDEMKERIKRAGKDYDDLIYARLQIISGGVLNYTQKIPLECKYKKSNLFKGLYKTTFKVPYWLSTGL